MNTIKSAEFTKALKAIAEFKSIDSVKSAFQIAAKFTDEKNAELKLARLTAIPLLIAQYKAMKKAKELDVTQKEFLSDILSLKAASVTRLVKLANIHVQFPDFDVVNTPINDVDKAFEPVKDADGKTVKDGDNVLYQRKVQENEVKFEDMTITEQIEFKKAELLKVQERIKKLKDEERTIEKMIQELSKLESEK